jgi:hypothetical protein
MQLAIDFVLNTFDRYMDNQFTHEDGRKQEQVTIAVASQSASVASFFSELESRFVARATSIANEPVRIGDECLRIGPVVVVRYKSPIAHRGDTSIGAVVEDCLILNEEWQRTMWACQLSAKRYFKFEVAVLSAALVEA